MDPLQGGGGGGGGGQSGGRVSVGRSRDLILGDDALLYITYDAYLDTPYPN